MFYSVLNVKNLMFLLDDIATVCNKNNLYRRINMIYFFISFHYIFKCFDFVMKFQTLHFVVEVIIQLTGFGGLVTICRSNKQNISSNVRCSGKRDRIKCTNRYYVFIVKIVTISIIQKRLFQMH